MGGWGDVFFALGAVVEVGDELLLCDWLCGGVVGAGGISVGLKRSRRFKIYIHIHPTMSVQSDELKPKNRALRSAGLLRQERQVSATLTNMRSAASNFPSCVRV